MCIHTYRYIYMHKKNKEKKAMGLRERKSREGEREIAKKSRWERLETRKGREK